MRREELLARTRPAERHHHSLVADLLRRGKAERRQRPGSRGHLQVTPHRYPGATARAEDSVYLGNRTGCGAPDPPETGDNVERRRVPRQGVHIAHPDVAVRVPVPGHRHQPGRGVDTGAGSAAQPGQLDGEPGPASHIEQPVPGIDAEPVVHSDVLPAVARLAEGREVHHLTAPALVHQRPRGRVSARLRHCRSFAPPDFPPRVEGRRSARAGRQRAYDLAILACQPMFPGGLDVAWRPRPGGRRCAARGPTRRGRRAPAAAGRAARWPAPRRPAVTEQPGEREQADRERDPRPDVAEVGDPGDAGDLASGKAAGGVHAERKDGGPAADIVAEPGPDDLAGDQGKEPYHGQAPEHQSAGGESLPLRAEFPQRRGRLGDLASGQGGDGQRATSDPVVAVSGEQFSQVEPGDGEDIEGQRHKQDRNQQRPRASPAR